MGTDFRGLVWKRVREITFLVRNRVRIWRTGRHISIKNSQEHPPAPPPPTGVLSKPPTDSAIPLPPRPQGFSASENGESPGDEVGNKDHLPLSNCTWINHTLLQHLCFWDSSIPQIQHLIKSRPEKKARVQDLYDPNFNWVTGLGRYWKSGDV